MDFTCELCGAKLSIPDERLPKGKTVKTTCPSCKGKITLDLQGGEEQRESVDTAQFRLRFIDRKSKEKAQENSYTYEDYASDETLAFYEEGVKLALIMADSAEHSKQINKALKELGYEPISTPNTRDTIGKLRFHHFDLIVLVDGFSGQPVENSQIINFLNRLPMSVRRRIFLALVSEKFKTMDNMMAFARSANVVINLKDIDKLHLVLKKAIAENEKFYKVFMDALVETGRG